MSRVNETVPVETYPALAAIPDLLHGFVTRTADVPVSEDKAAVIAALAPVHAAARARLGMAAFPYVTAEQVHGRAVAVVTGEEATPLPGVDALVTRTRGLALGVHVADCGPVFAADPEAGVLGLAHSGRKGTELNITGAMIDAMKDLGARPERMTVVLGPCIRPPHYEVDFASEILAQALRAGVATVVDAGHNTAADLGRYYSYRMEKGRTGRMVALMAWRP